MILQDKKAEGHGVLATIILIIFFVVIWFLWLGKFVADNAGYMIDLNNLTGVEAFGFANMNLFIMIGLILGTIAYLYFKQ